MSFLFGGKNSITDSIVERMAANCVKFQQDGESGWGKLFPLRSVL